MYRRAPLKNVRLNEKNDPIRYKLTILARVIRVITVQLLLEKKDK